MQRNPFTHPSTPTFREQSRLAWSSRDADTVRAMARVHNASPHHDTDFHAAPCPTRTPEPHGQGEFPLTCYRCHLYADA